MIDIIQLLYREGVLLGVFVPGGYTPIYRYMLVNRVELWLTLRNITIVSVVNLSHSHGE